MPKLDTFWDRLVYAMQQDGYKGPTTQTAIGAYWKVKQTGARKWQEGGLPKLSRVVAMAIKLNVMTEWLLSNRPPMRPMEPLTETEVGLVERFRALHPSKQDQLIHWLAVEASMPGNDNGDPPPANSLDSGSHISLK